MKQGIFGGTFDPPHIGHLILAERVRQELKLDKVRFIPARIPPHKTGDEVTPGLMRAAMVRLATNGNPSFTVDERELERTGPSFTVDTLEELKREDPSRLLVLIIGADNLVDFASWKDPERILEAAEVVAVSRPGVEVRKARGYEGRIRLLELPGMAISSSEIRERVRKGESIRYLVPDAVERFIEGKGLYRKAGGLLAEGR